MGLMLGSKQTWQKIRAKTKNEIFKAHLPIQTTYIFHFISEQYSTCLLVLLIRFVFWSVLSDTQCQACKQDGYKSRIALSGCRFVADQFCSIALRHPTILCRPHWNPRQEL